MGTRSDPQSHTWTLEAVSNILTTNTKMLKCEAEEEFSALVPEDLLCYFSRYYAALLRGGDAESGQDNITLELNSTQAQWFVTWLYTGRFPEDFDYPTLFQLYVFAEETEITALRRGIMTYIHEQSHRRANPSTEDAAEAFDRLPKSSGLVRWIVERFALHGGADTLWDYPDFFVHVAHAFDNFYKHACPTVRRLVFMDPCCSVIHDYGCDSNCAHPADMVKRGQACAYHEHSSPEEWKTCAGDDFEQSVDLIYLKGKTATDAVPQLRFAKFDASNSMVYTLSRRP
ncbi:hypothetical protein KCU91_g5580, partial [Aureobasidium melanogenum]